jgi:hypothetical protein
VAIDILHEKLIVLENVARKRNHELKDKITLILSRFHIHKNRPAFVAALVLKPVCSKEEEAVLDKEPNKGNNKITELRTILQRESQNSSLYKQTKSVNNRKTVKTVMTLTWYRHF